MATQNCMDRLAAAEDACLLARATSDTINAAAWGQNNTNESPPWVFLHARTVEALVAHIDDLVAIIRGGGLHG